MAEPVTLRGITWRHTRGLVPLLATAQAYEDLHPEVTIRWETRSLWAFGQGDIARPFSEFDMVVVDHPFIGRGVEAGLLVALEDVVDPTVLADLEADSVGPSHRSYRYRGRHWALAIDAAGQTAASRPDLLAAAGVSPPGDWTEVVDLARDSGRVALPLAPIDVVSCWFTLCAQLGAPPCDPRRDVVVDRDTGRQALQLLRQLVAVVPDQLLGMNPIAVLTRMATTDRWWYCPLTYSYSNYSRDGYAPHLLAFHDIPALDGRRAGAVLGGAGLALSARSAVVDHAAAYATWVAGAQCQASLYALSGGQPGNRRAWQDDLVDRVAHGFFSATLATMDAAYLRPNFPGFAEFQHDAAEVLHDALTTGQPDTPVLDAIDHRFAAATAALTEVPR